MMQPTTSVLPQTSLGHDIIDPSGTVLRDLQAAVDKYGWITEQLLSLPRDGSESTKHYNLSLIRAFGHPRNILALLKQILADQPLLSEIAGRSYRHTNHFDKIVLVDTKNHLGYRLTIHLWAPPYTELEVCDEQIHDHRFSFWSTILAGQIVFQNYVRDGSGVVFKEYQYIPEKLNVSTVGNYYIDVGDSPLLEVERSGETEGKYYYLPYSRIHRVVLPTRLSCTLVLRGPRQKNYASVFSNSQKYDPSGNTMFSPAELAGKLRTIVQAVELRLA